MRLRGRRPGDASASARRWTLLPRDTAEAAAVHEASCTEHEVPVVGARRGHRARRRSDAGRGRRRRRHGAHARRARAERRPSAGRACRPASSTWSSRAPARARGPLLRPGPLEPAGLHDRRQRGRELRRPALLQVRGDDAPRPGAGDRARGRRGARPLRAPTVDPDGFDLVGLFVGCEGMFGIATEITVRWSRPRGDRDAAGDLPSLDGACDTVSDIIARRLEPSALEILDKLTIEAVEDSVFAAGYPREAEAVLLIDVEGIEVEVATTVARSTPSPKRTARSSCAPRATRRRAQEALGRTQGRLRRDGSHRAGPVRRRRRRAAHQAARAGRAHGRDLPREAG